MTRETRTFLLYGIEIAVTAPVADWAWLGPLLARSKEPFKVLRQIGYVPVEEKA